jgi:hypothetical protein
MTTDAEYKRFFDAVRDTAMFRQAVFEIVAEGCSVSFALFLRECTKLVGTMVADMVPNAMAIAGMMNATPGVENMDQESFAAAVMAARQANPDITPIGAVKAALEALSGAAQEGK